VEYIKVFSYDYLIVPFCFCMNGLFNGAGHTTFSLINASLSSLLLRLPASYVFGITMGYGLSGVAAAAPAASLGTLILVIIFYLSGRWKVNVVDVRKGSDITNG